MLTWILVVLGIYLVQLYLVPALRFYGLNLTSAEAMKLSLGPRDDLPPMSVLAGRADRALNNMKESLPIFITFALLAMLLGKDQGQAVYGAMVFALARGFYVPAYLSGITGLRSAVWAVAAVGLVMMLLAILG